VFLEIERRRIRAAKNETGLMFWQVGVASRHSRLVKME
jgi:hypothetical protein